jgi:hypothetical protein
MLSSKYKATSFESIILETSSWRAGELIGKLIMVSLSQIARHVRFITTTINYHNLQLVSEVHTFQHFGYLDIITL